MGIFDLNDDKVVDIVGQRVALNTSLKDDEKIQNELRRSKYSMSLSTSGVLEIDNTSKSAIKWVDLDSAHSGIMGFIEKYVQNGVIEKLKVPCTLCFFHRLEWVGGKNIPNNIECNKICWYDTRILKDVNVCVSGKDRLSSSCIFDMGFPDCSNVTIDFEGNFSENAMTVEDGEPNKGLVSNTPILRLKLFSHKYSGKVLDLFDTQSCEIYDNDLKVQKKVVAKTLEKALAIANNKKRYDLISPLLKLKQGARLSDVLPLKNFSELNVVHITNNNAYLRFVRKGSVAERPQMGLRVPKDVDFKVTSRGLDGVVECTADGWYVMWGKEV